MVRLLQVTSAKSEDKNSLVSTTDVNVSLKIFPTVRFTPSEDFYEGGDLLHRLSEDMGRGQPIFALNYCNLHNSGFKIFRKFNYLTTHITRVDHYY